MNCAQCRFYVAGEGTQPPAGQCCGMPPQLLLLPVQATPRDELLALAKPRGAQPQMGMQVQGLRPVVLADSIACSLYVERTEALAD